MKMTRCSGPDLHFYDGEKYSVCPVCGYPEAGKNDSTVESGPKEHKEQKKRWFKNFQSKSGKAEEEAKDMIGYAPEETWAMTEVLTGTPDSERGVLNLGGSPTSSGNDTKVMNDVIANDQENSMKINQLFNDVDNANIRNSAAAMHDMNANTYDSEKTIGRYSDAETEPVVAWLVCVKGECQGGSYTLKTGKNMIGRGPGMDVIIPEPSVSRDRHAILTYEPRKRVFLLQPGDGSGLVYLNDTLLMSYSELKSRDVIQLGEALFVFFPFCGEEFSWEDYIEG